MLLWLMLLPMRYALYYIAFYFPFCCVQGFGGIAFCISIISQLGDRYVKHEGAFAESCANTGRPEFIPWFDIHKNR